MLGLVVLSLAMLNDGKIVLASISFVACLSFKQMALYYAPAIFAYILGVCFRKRSILLLVKYGVVVVSSFVIIFLPFLDSMESFGQALHRIFPFARGLYEDKVANFWCALNTFVKLRKLFDQPFLQKLR